MYLSTYIEKVLFFFLRSDLPETRSMFVDENFNEVNLYMLKRNFDELNAGWAQ